MSRGDIADRAASREQENLADALAQQQRRAEADRALGDAPTRCVDCGLKLSIARMRAVRGCKRCTDCQELIEIMRKRT